MQTALTETQPARYSCTRLQFLALGLDSIMASREVFYVVNSLASLRFCYIISFFPEITRRYEIYIVTQQALETRPGKQIQNLTVLSSKRYLKVLINATLKAVVSATFNFFSFKPVANHMDTSILFLKSHELGVNKVRADTCVAFIVSVPLR